MQRRHLLIAAIAVIIVLLRAKPATLWEFDEPLFSQALHRYDPIAHHPPPPGYPVFVFVAQLARAVIPTDFAALVTLSVLASAIGFVVLALAFARIAGDDATGICGALLFYLSPAMLVHATLPVSEAGALALVAAALFFSPSSGAAFATFAALAVGWRPQFAIFILPLLFARRPNPRTLAVFALVCLAWLLPLIAATGGPENLLRYETRQAKYLAAHDAAISRSAWKPAAIAVHFVSHPWGPRVMALPVLAAAAIGAWRLRRRAAVVPLAIAAVVYIAIALIIMDPADGVRYAIPWTLAVALFAASGVVAISKRPYAVVALFAGGSMVYVSSLVVQRSTMPSPPMQAATYGRASLPHGAAVGYEMSLWPHATYLFGDHPLMPMDVAAQQLADRDDIPLFGFINGYSNAPGSRAFAWEPSDAYWNLTRNLYRVVSWMPIGPERRFKPLRGVYALERERPSESWRWLDADAAIEGRGATGIALQLALPREYAADGNTVTVLADGVVSGQVRIRPGEVRSASFAFSAPARIVQLRSERAITPPRDPRRLAVELYDLVLRFDRSAAAKRRAA